MNIRTHTNLDIFNSRTISLSVWVYTECGGGKGERSDAKMFLVELLENKLLFQIGKEQSETNWEMHQRFGSVQMSFVTPAAVQVGIFQ